MQSITPETPGARLREARKRAGYTQKDIEATCGISQPALSEFESGKTADMGATALLAICRKVGVTVEYVLQGGPITAQEAEAVALLRGASDGARALALASLRGMLATDASGKRAANGQ